MTARAAGDPVVCTPLRSEHATLRSAAVNLPVHRTGRGPRASTAWAARTMPGPVLVAGVAGAVAPVVRPGDVVVADEVRSEDGSVPCPAAPLLAGALRRHGLAVHLGPVASSQALVTGTRARAALAAGGALAVDTESAWLIPPGQPWAVVRTIVDTPDHALLHPGTAGRGIRALRALRAAAPAMAEWLAALGPREIVLAGPRSFCAGVDRAIDTVDRALDRHGPPVYVRRQIVHNAHVVRRLEARGAIFVEELTQVPPGARVVLSAHGVAPSVRAEAHERELSVIDATCPLVTKVHSEVRRYARQGDTVLLIGHADHEEVVGTVGEAPDKIRVVDGVDAAHRVSVPDPDRVAYVMQTTLATDEADGVAAVLRERFPRLRAPRRDDICYATTNRQQAVRAVAEATDLVLVVGSANSSNSLRLVEVAERAGAESHLVEDAGEVDLRWLAGASRIGITAGASAPPHLVDQLVDALAGLGPVTVREHRVTDEDVYFSLPLEVS